MRLKILGMVAVAALVVAMGTIGFKSEKASAAPVQVSLLGGAGGSFSWSATFSNDETAGAIVLYTNALPVGSTGTFGAAVTCSVDANANGVIDAAEIGNVLAANCVVVATNAGPGPGGLPPTAPSLTVTLAAAADANTVENLFQLSGTFTTTATIGSVITVNANQAGAVIGGSGQVAIADPSGCSANSDATTISVCKVDQRGTRLSATFALQGPNFVANLVTGTTAGGQGCTTALVNAGTACTPAPASNPCKTNWECARVLQNGVVSSAPALGISTLPAGTYTLTEATAGGYGCTQIQVVNGYGQVLPPGQPITVVIPATDPRATTFIFTNSCLLPGSPNAAGSSIVTVIGGSSFGLSNTTNVEIAPAPGSDDDARIDIRIRDSANIPLPNAHVFVMTDKGRLAVRQDLTGPTIVGYDVVEPSSPNYGLNTSGDSCDQFPASVIGSTAAVPQTVIPAAFASFLNPYLGSPSQQIQDGFTNVDGIISACLYVADDLVPGITPGKANITVIVEAPNQYFGIGYLGGGAGNLVLTSVVTVVGPPASVKVTASPTTLQCGEKATITATITDAVGQNVSDHTRVELVSNFGSTIGGTGATLGFPGAGPTNPISSSAAETFSGVATAFLLTSTEHVGPYEVVVASGGSTGGVYTPTGYNGYNTIPQLAGVNFPLYTPPSVSGQSGIFSTAPVSAQATVTCALPVAAAPVVPIPPIVAPRTGEGIRPPNTGDAGLASTSGGSSTLFIVGGLVFAVAGIVTLKVARQ